MICWLIRSFKVSARAVSANEVSARRSTGRRHDGMARGLWRLGPRGFFMTPSSRVEGRGRRGKWEGKTKRAPPLSG